MSLQRQPGKGDISGSLTHKQMQNDRSMFWRNTGEALQIALIFFFKLTVIWKLRFKEYYRTVSRSCLESPVIPMLKLLIYYKQNLAWFLGSGISFAVNEKYVNDYNTLIYVI